MCFSKTKVLSADQNRKRKFIVEERSKLELEGHQPKDNHLDNAKKAKQEDTGVCQERIFRSSNKLTSDPNRQRRKITSTIHGDSLPRGTFKISHFAEPKLPVNKPNSGIGTESRSKRSQVPVKQDNVGREHHLLSSNESSTDPNNVELKDSKVQSLPGAYAKLGSGSTANVNRFVTTIKTWAKRVQEVRLEEERLWRLKTMLTLNGGCIHQIKDSPKNRKLIAEFIEVKKDLLDNLEY